MSELVGINTEIGDVIDVTETLYTEFKFVDGEHCTTWIENELLYALPTFVFSIK